jgi:uncharacterized protein YcgL (UPF0745 family)
MRLLNLGMNFVERHVLMKTTLKQVKEYIESEGFELLSNEYKGSHNRLKIKCPNGHIFYKSFENFKRAKIKKCPACNYSKDYNSIKSDLKEKGFDLLTPNSDTWNIVKLKCSNGHVFYKNLSSIYYYKDFKCPICLNKYPRLRVNYDEIKEFLESKGFTLLTPESELYSIAQKVEVICPKGHKSFVNLSSLENGLRDGRTCCKKCDIENRKLDFNVIKKNFEDEGFIVVSTKEEYKNIYTSIKLICPNKHKTRKSYYSFLKCKTCSVCKGKRKEVEWL